MLCFLHLDARILHRSLLSWGSRSNYWFCSWFYFLLSWIILWFLFRNCILFSSVLLIFNCTRCCCCSRCNLRYSWLCFSHNRRLCWGCCFSFFCHIYVPIYFLCLFFSRSPKLSLNYERFSSSPKKTDQIITQIDKINTRIQDIPKKFILLQKEAIQIPYCRKDTIKETKTKQIKNKCFFQLVWHWFLAYNSQNITPFF